MKQLSFCTNSYRLVYDSVRYETIILLLDTARFRTVIVSFTIWHIRKQISFVYTTARLETIIVLFTQRHVQTVIVLCTIRHIIKQVSFCQRFDTFLNSYRLVYNSATLRKNNRFARYGALSKSYRLSTIWHVKKNLFGSTRHIINQ